MKFSGFAHPSILENKLTTSVYIAFKDNTVLSFESNSTKEEVRKTIADAFTASTPLTYFEDVFGDVHMFCIYEVATVNISVNEDVERSKWVQDIFDMHDKFGFHDRIATMTPDEIQMYVKFRIDFLREELTETYNAYYEGDAEEIVDGLIDLCVVAIGTLDAFNVDAEEAWDAVHKANMAKQAGVKPNRPNPLKLPDLMKPAGWTAPSHAGNHGLLAKAFEDSTPTREE